MKRYVPILVLVIFCVQTIVNGIGLINNINLEKGLSPKKGSVITGYRTQTVGDTLSDIGDFNKDGIDDIFFTTADTTRPVNGKYQSYVVYGRNGGYSKPVDLKNLTPKQGFEIVHLNTAQVAKAGDINNDGIADIVIGGIDTPYLDRTFQGSVFVLYGVAGGYSSRVDLTEITPSQGFVIQGIASFDNLGQYSSKTIGDFNKDGIDDLVVTTSYINETELGCFLIYGRNGAVPGGVIDLKSLDPSIGFIITGHELLQPTGIANDIGDFNHDGIADFGLKVIESGGEGGRSDRNYIIYGVQGGYSNRLDLTNLTSAQGVKIFSSSPQIPFFGDQSVRSAGDFNHDGIPDVALNCYYDLQKNNPVNNTDSIYVIYGKAGGYSSPIDVFTLPESQGFRISIPSNANNYAVGIKDVNDDGIDELLVCFPQDNFYLGNTGRRFSRGIVLYGRTGGYNSVALSKSLTLKSLSLGFNIKGGKNKFFCERSSSAGDFNHDGHQDFMVSNYGRIGAGSIYVFYGGAQKNNQNGAIPCNPPNCRIVGGKRSF